MSQQQNKTVTRGERAQWKRPEVRRIKAGDAEAGGGFGADGVFS